MFKTAQELKISFEEHAGLIHILGIFERQAIPHQTSGFASMHTGALILASERRDRIKTRAVGFNMGYGASVRVNANHDRVAETCGTACCIGGHLSLHMQGFDVERDRTFPVAAFVKANNYVMGFDEEDHDHPLYDLFFPQDVGDYDQLTVSHAAQATRNFLTTGHSNWQRIYEEQIRVEPDEPY